jgi:O-antigen ligase
MFQELQRENVIIHTNGVEIANPFIIAKYDKARVHGTLVYPNALAGIVLLLLPAAVVLVWQNTRRLRRVTWLAAMGMTVFLGLAGLFWSGSKSGWLIALAIGVFWLCRLNWPRRLKWMVVLALVAGGLIVFGVRFQSYFAKGATSVGARFDYWHAAVRVVAGHPVFGTGPGTFQRPYAVLKRPDAEMARLVHNDYLEQFSDSGIVGGLSYAAWIALLLWTLGRRVWTADNWFQFAIFAGLLGWFIQGFIEFSLFVPALAWTAFALSGCLLAWSANQVDKRKLDV